MNLGAIIHETKSQMAYACDATSLQIWLKTAKNDIQSVSLRAVDPFNWTPSKENPEIYQFESDTIRDIPMKKMYATEIYDIWRAEVKGFKWSRIRYCFIVSDGNEEIMAGCQGFVDLKKEPEERNNYWHYYNFPYILEEDIYRAPDWIKNTIWYQIFPNNFTVDGLEGVIGKLDYIHDMGFNGIYFTPVFQSPSEHKYDTTDYFKIDERFGTNEIFKNLVDEAHKRGIHIMLDAVFNHCGYYHPFWQDVIKNGKESKYADCFYIFDWNKPIEYDELEKGEESHIEYKRQNLNYRTFAYEPGMPKWNTSHPLVRDYLLKAARYWVEEYDIDGWRLDVSNEVSHDFWREFRKQMREIKPDIYILGENWDNSAAWLQGDQMDAVMNYEFMIPTWNFFGKSNDKKADYSATQFKYAINRLLSNYSRLVTENMFNLLESHDTARLMTVCGGETAIVKLAYVTQMSFGGAPSVYYGGEIGLDGDHRNNRSDMIWNEGKQNIELKEHIKKLIDIRKKYDAMRVVDIEWLCAKDETSTLIFIKKGTGHNLYVMIHNSPRDLEIILPSSMQYKTMLDVMSGKSLSLQDAILLESYGFFLLIEELK